MSFTDKSLNSVASSLNLDFLWPNNTFCMKKSWIRKWWQWASKLSNSSRKRFICTIRRQSFDYLIVPLLEHCKAFLCALIETCYCWRSSLTLVRPHVAALRPSSTLCKLRMTVRKEQLKMLVWRNGVRIRLYKGTVGSTWERKFRLSPELGRVH